MYLCRFLNNDNHPQYGLLDGSKIFSLNNLFHIELDFNCIKDFISDEINISDIIKMKELWAILLQVIHLI